MPPARSRSPRRAPAAAIMVCGTTSGAGKSFLATALARWYAREGFDVAPFKAQNMSNNARIVDGGEMGSAQYFQALAARALPEVRMNPVLLKPEKDTQSQVIVLGRPDRALSRLPWRERAERLWPIVKDCLAALGSEHELLIIEGAGSPAEINLQSTDIVNMRIAEAASAATLLIADIDRGGAFAHLYGTHQLLPFAQRALLRGFVLNKFRGDAQLLPPGPAMLEELTGVPTLGVLPMWREHGLPEEDGVFDAEPSGGGFNAVVLAYPRISNLDEFAPLKRVSGLSLSWARRPESVARADLLILPGSKHVAEDLGWIRRQRLDAAIAAHIEAGKPTLALCGGLQLLGTSLRDPKGIEGAASGLGILPLITEYQQSKRQRRGRYTFDQLSGFWEPLSGQTFEGYEIRHGRTEVTGAIERHDSLRLALPGGVGWQQGPVLALYTHGLFESGAVLKALFGAATPSLEETLDGLADFVGEHLGAERLRWLADAARAQVGR